MREWTYRFAVPLVLVALIPTLVGLHYLGEAQKKNCRQTYRSFPLMFSPFFPKTPQVLWTAKQRSDWKKLQDRADELAARC